MLNYRIHKISAAKYVTLAISEAEILIQQLTRINIFIKKILFNEIKIHFHIHGTTNAIMELI